MIEICFDQIDSTNTYLKNNYERLDDLTIVQAAYQSKGRGRKGRVWLAEKDQALMFSVLVKDPKLLKKYKGLSVISALSIIEVLKDHGITEAKLKWPNDVYADDKKICGILLEGISTDKLETVIIGIGLNVNQEAFAGDYLIEPVSMYSLTGRKFSITDLKYKVYEQLLYNLEQLKNGYDFFAEISSCDYLKGRRVTALFGNDSREVTVSGINEDYSLKVKDENGEYYLEAGEVSFHV